MPTSGILSETNLSSLEVVTPVKTGVHEFRNSLNILDSGFRRNDQKHCFSTFYEAVNTVLLLVILTDCSNLIRPSFQLKLLKRIEVNRHRGSLPFSSSEAPLGTVGSAARKPV